jgi:hypothetical protein
VSRHFKKKELREAISSIRSWPSVTQSRNYYYHSNTCNYAVITSDKICNTCNIITCLLWGARWRHDFHCRLYAVRQPRTHFQMRSSEKLNSSFLLSTPWQHIAGTEVQLQSFVTSELDGRVVNVTHRPLYPRGTTPVPTE